MTEKAPERIWTDGQDYWANPTIKDDKTEYIRADLIEELEAAIEWQISRAEAAEAKLEKAVKAIELARDGLNGLIDSNDAFDSLNATIAELKGET